ncbi:hypothetical protein cypCar_00018229 [Cyprinus carpio]|nr:hypothetical protein cypCar_00018229 [Cyprinus carpio]
MLIQSVESLDTSSAALASARTGHLQRICGFLNTYTIVFISECLFLESRESHTCGIGFKSENKSCVDTDECVMDPGVCGNHAQCFNTPGSYYCTCDEGFQSTPPNFTQTTGQCLDINECLVGTYECSADLECVNTIGSFNCSCPKGYKTSRLDAGCEGVCPQSYCLLFDC